MSGDLQHPILAGLNAEQQAAAEQVKGPLLILAGAGSGKTRVIVHRIAYLIQGLNVSPFRILAVTFTNKAAQEMRERVAQLVSPEVSGKLMISTFHSACLRILRQHIDLLGMPKDFVVYDASDQLVLIKSCISDLEINEDLFPPRKLLAQIGQLKHQLISPESYADRAGDFGFEAVLKKAYSLYQAKLTGLKALDFDDLIGSTIHLFQSRPELLQVYHGRFQYIMVDEYQDTNHAQYQLIRLLTSPLRNLCVVGDDDQSIYAFRGADVGNILSFERDFPDAKVVILNQNYRSSGTILSAASAMIEKNPNRKQKNLWTENDRGEPIVWGKVADENAEARFVLRTISSLRETQGCTLSDFSVLYRTNAQSRVIEEALRMAGVPYLIYGGLRFYDRKEVKDLIAYLRLMVYPADDIALRRIINLPQRGIGQLTFERLSHFAELSQIPLLDAVSQSLRLPDRLPAEDLDATLVEGIGLSPQARRGLRHFLDLIVRLQSFAADASLPQLVRFLIEETAYLDYLKKTFGTESESRIENVLELVAAADEFIRQEGLEVEYDLDGEQIEVDRSGLACVKAFLDQIALVSSGEENNETEKGVTLMTLHSAKGLEFPVVFLVGMEEGLFPHTRSLTNAREMEEERRLCYVGMTRAKERLYLISAAQRRLYGTSHWNNPSRFIKDLPRDGVKVLESSPVGGEALRPLEKGLSPSTRSRPEKQVLDSFSRVIEVGAMVRHTHFGIGRVERYEGSGEACKVTVSFDSSGVKKMALKYANLERW